jgi:hypothetical protein
MHIIHVGMSGRYPELKIDFEKLSLDAARFRLEESWFGLLPFVCDALEFRRKAAEEPKLLQNNWASMHVRFLDEFESELTAIQAVHKAAIDRLLIVDDVEIARQTADMLFEISQQAQELIAH